ncbi:esterase/lipase family protein [Sphingomonas sp. OTU376]|uniref:esterase/lipase family protein n=1 Tax=Sphingomonas sp. OTU376 TaxID=3043863 RepID=UPI00313BF7C9
MIVLRTLPALAAGLMLSSATVPAAAGMKAAPAKCTSGWVGNVQYSRHIANSQDKTVARVSGKGTDTTSWSMTYDYAAQVTVRATDNPDISLGRANINLKSISIETKAAQDTDMCMQQRMYRTVSGNFVSKSETRANGNGLDADVNIGVDTEGTYRVSVRLPEIKGVVSGSESGSFRGQCKAKEGASRTIADLPTTIDPVQFSSDGSDRVDPREPDRLTGSHSETLAGATDTLSWNLRRCGGALRLVDLKFEDMRFPTWGAWRKITEQTGTIDGNIVRITATVANDGPEEKLATLKLRETYKGDKWDGAKPDSTLDEGTLSVPAGEQRDITFEWDSSGYAWYDDGRPRLVQRIRAEVEDKGKKADEMTRNLKVVPKPVVLVHGLWSNWQAWEIWQNILTTSHSYDWKAFPVGEKPEHGRMRTGDEPGNFAPTNTIDENAAQLSRYVEYAQTNRNAWHVDLVAHSMGGLISRRYIHAAMPIYPDGKPQVGHLVMLGTPNRGSSCADLISIPLELAGKSMDALRELRPVSVLRFNQVNVNRKGVPFSILAGNPLPPVCRMLAMNDGVVAESSAIWTIEDHAVERTIHTSLTGTSQFSSFVKPRLAIGPGKQGAQGKLAALLPGGGGGRLFEFARACLEFLGLADPKDPDAGDFSKVAMLAPGQVMEIAIPVEDARNFGVTFVAANTVSATLADDKGTALGSNLAGNPEASQLFRGILVDRAITRATWKLTLRNEDKVERQVVLSTWSNAR